MLTRHYAKPCAVEDFADPDLAALIAEIAPTLSAEQPHRKGWEFAMGALFLRDAGLLTADAAILDVGAGHEEILFWLANRCGRVVATDIYGEGGFAHREAAPTMLSDPAAFAPYPYPEERLEVRGMDARELAFDDHTFDAVISLSSIEHFGGPRDKQRAAAEIGRVLKPGGVAFIVTEMLIQRSLLTSPLVQTAVRAGTLNRRFAQATPRRRVVCEALTAAEIRRDIIAPSGLDLAQPLDTAAPPSWRDNIQTLQPDGTTVGPHGPFPHVAVSTLGATWTSLCLPLEKPG